MSECTSEYSIDKYEQNKTINNILSKCNFNQNNIYKSKSINFNNIFNNSELINSNRTEKSLVINSSSQTFLKDKFLLIPKSNMNNTLLSNINKNVENHMNNINRSNGNAKEIKLKLNSMNFNSNNNHNTLLNISEYPKIINDNNIECSVNQNGYLDLINKKDKSPNLFLFNNTNEIDINKSKFKSNFLDKTSKNNSNLDIIDFNYKIKNIDTNFDNQNLLTINDNRYKSTNNINPQTKNILGKEGKNNHSNSINSDFRTITHFNKTNAINTSHKKTLSTINFENVEIKRNFNIVSLNQNNINVFGNGRLFINNKDNLIGFLKAIDEIIKNLETFLKKFISFKIFSKYIHNNGEYNIDNNKLKENIILKNLIFKHFSISTCIKSNNIDIFSLLNQSEIEMFSKKYTKKISNLLSQESVINMFIESAQSLKIYDLIKKMQSKEIVSLESIKKLAVEFYQLVQSFYNEGLNNFMKSEKIIQSINISESLRSKSKNSEENKEYIFNQILTSMINSLEYKNITEKDIHGQVVIVKTNKKEKSINSKILKGNKEINDNNNTSTSGNTNKKVILNFNKYLNVNKQNDAAANNGNNSHDDINKISDKVLLINNKAINKKSIRDSELRKSIKTYEFYLNELNKSNSKKDYKKIKEIHDIIELVESFNKFTSPKIIDENDESQKFISKNQKYLENVKILMKDKINNKLLNYDSNSSEEEIVKIANSNKNKIDEKHINKSILNDNKINSKVKVRIVNDKLKVIDSINLNNEKFQIQKITKNLNEEVINKTKKVKKKKSLVLNDEIMKELDKIDKIDVRRKINKYLRNKTISYLNLNYNTFEIEHEILLVKSKSAPNLMYDNKFNSNSNIFIKSKKDTTELIKSKNNSTNFNLNSIIENINNKDNIDKNIITNNKLKIYPKSLINHSATTIDIKQKKKSNPFYKTSSIVNNKNIINKYQTNSIKNVDLNINENKLNNLLNNNSSISNITEIIDDKINGNKYNNGIINGEILNNKIVDSVIKIDSKENIEINNNKNIDGKELKSNKLIKIIATKGILKSDNNENNLEKSKDNLSLNNSIQNKSDNISDENILENNEIKDTFENRKKRRTTFKNILKINVNKNDEKDSKFESKKSIKYNDYKINNEEETVKIDKYTNVKLLEQEERNRLLEIKRIKEEKEQRLLSNPTLRNLMELLQFKKKIFYKNFKFDDENKDNVENKSDEINLIKKNKSSLDLVPRKKISTVIINKEDKMKRYKKTILFLKKILQIKEINKGILQENENLEISKYINVSKGLEKLDIDNDIVENDKLMDKKYKMQAMLNEQQLITNIKYLESIGDKNLGITEFMIQLEKIRESNKNEYLRLMNEGFNEIEREVLNSAQQKETERRINNFIRTLSNERQTNISKKSLSKLVIKDSFK